MSSILPVNIQQIMQMGTHTEKLQHTIQSLPNVTSLQVDKERQQDDILKVNRVQYIGPSYLLQKTAPKTRVKKRIRGRDKNQSHDEVNNSEFPLSEDPYKGNINIIA